MADALEQCHAEQFGSTAVFPEEKFSSEPAGDAFTTGLPESDSWSDINLIFRHRIASSEITTSGVGEASSPAAYAHRKRRGGRMAGLGEEKAHVKKVLEAESALAFQMELEEKERKEKELDSLRAQVSKLEEEARIRVHDFAQKQSEKDDELAGFRAQVSKLNEEAQSHAQDFVKVEAILEEQRKQADKAARDRDQARSKAAELAAQLQTELAKNHATMLTLDQGLVAIIEQAYKPRNDSKDLRRFIVRFFANNYDQLRQGTFLALPSSGLPSEYPSEFASDVMDLLFKDKRELETQLRMADPPTPLSTLDSGVLGV